MSEAGRTRRLLVTRPAADAAGIARALAARGIATLSEPMLSIEDVAGPPLDLEGVQALLVTSGNGARALARRTQARDLPVLAVGEASARAAREAGFAKVDSARGDVEALAALVVGRLKPEDGAVLHAAASDTAGDLAGRLGAAGFRYRREVLYRARAAERLSPGAVRALQQGEIDGVLLFSPRTASTFVTLLTDGGLADAASRMDAHCLSPAVADAAGKLAWKRVAVAERPDQGSLLATVEDHGPAAAATGTARPGEPGMADRPSDSSETAPGQTASGDAPAEAAAPADAPGADTGEGETRPEAPSRKRGGFGVVAGTLVAVAAICGAAAATWPYWSPRLAALLPQQAPDTVQAQRLQDLEERIARAESAPPGDDLAADLEAMKAERESLQASLRAIGDRVAALEESMKTLGASAGEASGAGLAGVEQRLSELENAGAGAAELRQRLEVLSARLNAGNSRDAAIEALTEQNRTLAEQVSALTSRIGEAEAARAQTGSAVGARSELLVAIAALRRLLNTAMPYADALDAVVQAAPQDSEAAAAIAPLRAHADAGIPTRDQLRSRFEEVGQAMVRADGAVEGDGWLERAADRLKGLVTVRRVGGGPSGTDVDAAVSHAETALAAGELAAAVRALENLGGPAATAAAPWLDDARARLDAEQALAALDLRAATLPAGGGR